MRGESRCVEPSLPSVRTLQAASIPGLELTRSPERILKTEVID